MHILHLQHIFMWVSHVPSTQEPQLVSGCHAGQQRGLTVACEGGIQRKEGEARLLVNSETVMVCYMVSFSFLLNAALSSKPNHIFSHSWRGVKPRARHMGFCAGERKKKNCVPTRPPAAFRFKRWSRPALYKGRKISKVCAWGREKRPWCKWLKIRVGEKDLKMT